MHANMYVYTNISIKPPPVGCADEKLCQDAVL